MWRSGASPPPPDTNPGRRLPWMAVVVPPYCLSRQGRVFRLLRTSELVAPDRMRFVLRAVPILATSDDQGIEVTREVDMTLLRDKIAHGQAIPTPEETLEDLWQQLRLRLEGHSS